MRRFPPLAELIAFEAVARNASFTRAAAELCITQSAVSHRVQRLEKYFGSQLIVRLNPGLALTAAGTALLPELASVLDDLSQLDRLRPRAERHLRVVAGSALCNWWLAGRLPAFMAQRPDLSVDLTSIEAATTPIPEFDVQILWLGTGEVESSTTQVPLATEQIFPVCSPTLLPRSGALTNARDLAAMSLLHKSSKGASEWSWSGWFAYLGLAKTAHSGSVLRYADVGLVLSAAISGAGVALGRTLLVHDAMEAQRLTMPLPDVAPMSSSRRQVARWRREKVGDPDVIAFVTWLTAEVERTVSATRALHALPAES